MRQRERIERDPIGDARIRETGKTTLDRLHKVMPGSEEKRWVDGVLGRK